MEMKKINPLYTDRLEHLETLLSISIEDFNSCISGNYSNDHITGLLFSMTKLQGNILNFIHTVETSVEKP